MKVFILYCNCWCLVLHMSIPKHVFTSQYIILCLQIKFIPLKWIGETLLNLFFINFSGTSWELGTILIANFAFILEKINHIIPPSHITIVRVCYLLINAYLPHLFNQYLAAKSFGHHTIFSIWETVLPLKCSITIWALQSLVDRLHLYLIFYWI